MAGIDTAGLVAILGTIATLVFLEGLLSADNALVLAGMVRHLPKEQQKRALRYGIFGAFFFRFIAILFAATLLDYWWFKVVGGVYLLYLAVMHLVFGEGEDDDPERKMKVGKGFWGTVIGVELADIAFSIDSILAAVAMADGLPRNVADIALFNVPLADVTITMKLLVIYVGGILGILAMRFVAGYFLILLEKFAGLATGAYYLVAWIGVKLVTGGFYDALHPLKGEPGRWVQALPPWVSKIPLHMPEWLFWGGMGVILVLSFVIKPKNTAGHAPALTGGATEPLTQSVDHLDPELERATKLTTQALRGEDEAAP